jgi:CRISPR system Cascade subunit CasA
MSHTELSRGAFGFRPACRPCATVPATILAAVCAALPGCRTHTPAPLALDATEREFLVRSVDGPALAEYSARLAQHAPAAGAFDPTDGLSLAEAEAVALCMNRELRAARLAAGVTRATADNAGLWRDPTLGVDLSRVVGGVTGGGASSVEAMFSLGFTLPLSGRLEAERARADAAHRAELARVAAEEWRVLADLRRAWVARVALVAEADAARDVLVRVAQVVAVVERMEAAGEIARIEARLLKIEDAKLRAELRALDAEVARSTHDIESLLGLPPRADRRLVADFAVFSPIGRGVHALLASRVAERSPALALARARHDVAEAQLAEEIRATWPDLELAPGFGEDNGDRQAVLGVGVTLPVLDGNRRGIAEAEANRALARGEAEAVYERLLGDLLAAEERLSAAIARGELLETTLVPLVDTQYAEAREVARLGEVNTLILLESLKQQLDAKRQLIAARRDEALAAIDIAEITGPATDGDEP